jgi:hypothetical protein
MANKLDRPIIELPKHHSPLRSMMADACGGEYIALESLAAARNHPESVVIMEGDDGGTIYLTVPVYKVTCGEIALRHLLSDIDAMYWNDHRLAHLIYEIVSIGGTVAGGMGGGRVVDGLWLHPKVEELGVRQDIEQVLNGQRERIEMDRSHRADRNLSYPSNDQQK